MDHHGKVIAPRLNPPLTPVSILLAKYEQEYAAEISLQTGSSINPSPGYDNALFYCCDLRLTWGIICGRIWLRQHQARIWPACPVFLHIPVLSFFKDKCIFCVTRPSRGRLAYKGQITENQEQSPSGHLCKLQLKQMVFKQKVWAQLRMEEGRGKPQRTWKADWQDLVALATPSPDCPHQMQRVGHEGCR